MSKYGVRGFYLITDIIKDNLLNDENVNTVTTGDITKIDLSKQTIYPLSHIIVNTVTQEEQVLRFNISVICMDIVDVSKDEVTDIFVGNDNEQDILNTQLAVLNKLIELLRSGSLYTEKYQLDGVVSCEPFYDRFENEVAGWVGTMDILIDNDIYIC
tara:strand:- start:3783 stop:4253 length:471 start_codon:yes stop_codon:yes gene_type:complete